MREYLQAQRDPYAVPQEKSEALFKRYQAPAMDQKNVLFVCCLAQYRYYNMDQLVGAALTAAKKLLAERQRT